MGTWARGTGTASALSSLAGTGDKHACGKVGVAAAAGAEAAGPPRALPALSRESLRVGSSMVFKINVLSVMKTTLFT